jgi:hypothetical protein
VTLTPPAPAAQDRGQVGRGCLRPPAPRETAEKAAGIRAGEDHPESWSVRPGRFGKARHQPHGSLSRGVPRPLRPGRLPARAVTAGAVHRRTDSEWVRPWRGGAARLPSCPVAVLDTAYAGRAPSRSSGSGSASPLGKRPKTATMSTSHVVSVRSRRTRSGRERDAEVSSRTSAGAR